MATGQLTLARYIDINNKFCLILSSNIIRLESRMLPDIKGECCLILEIMPPGIQAEFYLILRLSIVWS